jgi:hypothetical protein
MATLTAVRAGLKSCNPEHATLFTSLIDTGKLSRYKAKEGVKRKFHPQDIDYPLLGKKHAPAGLQKAFSQKAVQDICLRDLPEAREYLGERLVYFTPSGTANDAAEPSKEDASMETINSLTDKGLDAAGGILSFPSDALEEMISKSWEAPEQLLRATITTCTVLPRKSHLPLHHSNEGTTITTLLFGFIVWIFWPPTDHNLTILQTMYENIASDHDEAEQDTTNNLEGGLIFVQNEREGLRLPPCSIMMGLTTRTSVLATYSEVTAENFIAMLQKLPLLRAWFQTELDGVRKRTEFNAAVLIYLDLLLNGDEEDEERDVLKLSHIVGGPLHTLLTVWDAIKDDMASMMGPADAEAMAKTWETFLVTAVGRECKICHKKLRNKQKLMRMHFIDKHWPESKGTIRIDSTEGVDDILDGVENTRQVLDNELGYGEYGSNAEVDEGETAYQDA